jgi:predicted kinase
VEAVIFVGIQAAGKSSFYLKEFFRSHVHINLDMLKTRHRENVFLQACFQTKMRFVVDNTNPTKADRLRYILPAKEHDFQLIGYYFQSKLDEALRRNQQRGVIVPDAAIRATYARLELPSYDEGFDELWYVEIGAKGFEVKAWQDEL